MTIEQYRASALPGAGTVLGDRYELLERIGEGHFGEVWSAADTSFTSRVVAVKLLKPEYLDSPQARLRFEREADALRALHHPCVVAVSDRGDWQGRPYLVMERAPGEPLAGWLEGHRKEGRVSQSEVVRAIFAQIVAGVAAAHGLPSPGPVIHRDIKAANVMLAFGPSGEPIVKVVDFGLARIGEGTSTATGVGVGTDESMAPEQAMGPAASTGPATVDALEDPQISDLEDPQESDHASRRKVTAAPRGISTLGAAEI